jgi:hypothetical protein
MRNAPSWARHIDVVGLDDRVPTSTVPDLRVVFSRIVIRSFSWWWEVDPPAISWMMVLLIRHPCDVMIEK